MRVNAKTLLLLLCLLSLLMLCGCGAEEPVLEPEETVSSTASSAPSLPGKPGYQLLGFAAGARPPELAGLTLLEWCQQWMDDPQWSAFGYDHTGRVEVAGGVQPAEDGPCRLRLVFSADRTEERLTLLEAVKDGEPLELTLTEIAAWLSGETDEE